MTDLSYLIAVLGIAISIATFYFGRTTASRNQGKMDGQMQTMLSNISEQVRSLNSKLDKQYIKSAKDIARLEVRVDALEKRG